MKPRLLTRGFTLIELMISITLVSVISAGMLMAIRAGLMTLEKTENRLQFNRRVMGASQMLTRQIGGVMPVTSGCGSGGGASVVASFRGTSDSLRLISSYSMQEGARGYPQFLEFQVIQAEGGGVRLIVNEHLYTGPASTAPFCADSQFLQVRPGPDSFVLADRLASCRFSYLESRPDQPLPGDWAGTWDKPDLPAAVRIDMVPLDSSPALLPVVNVTVPIHVTRQVRSLYEDIR